MKPLKHNKIKNTAILFESLIHQLTSDILAHKDSRAINLVKKYFTPSSALTKELELYKTLVESSELSKEKADYLVETVVKARKTLNDAEIDKLKYRLVRDIKESYDISNFFSHRIPLYKEYAAAYKMFRYNVTDNPKEHVDNKFTLIENLCSKKELIAENSNPPGIEEFVTESPEIRTLAYKFMIDKFNEKYSGLNESQQSVLRSYTMYDGKRLKEDIDTHAKYIQKVLTEKIHTVSDQVTKIKLNEVCGLLNNIIGAKQSKDDHVLGLLSYYELIDELNDLSGK